MENRKFIVAAYLLGAMILWFMVRSGVEYLHLQFYQVRRLPGIGLAREALPVLFGLVTFLVLLGHKKVNGFCEEVVAELKKVTWPNRPDVVRSTTVVLVCILIASAILATFDLFWGKLVSFLLKS